MQTVIRPTNFNWHLQKYWYFKQAQRETPNLVKKKLLVEITLVQSQADNV